ncbi:hypothetical protein GCM10022200_17170 [Microbacterium awajiense]|uniref:HTH araC/xylS-type domain-containing protein n=1 Tax=Microbacterium awajiense TaxID=415214 RepID=A0ABP7AJY0_9MICO
MSQLQPLDASPPAHFAARRHGDLRLTVTRFGSTVLTAGRAGEVLNVVRSARPTEPHVLILHARGKGGDPDRAQPSPHPTDFVLTDDLDAALPVSGDHIVVASMPRARVTTHLLAPMTPLAPTALVRASRALLSTLVRDLDEPDEPTARAAEDLVIGAVRAVIAEHPETSPPSSRRAPLALRLAALIDARHTDPDLDVDQIARELYASRRQLYRHASSSGVAGMLTERRVCTAQELLDREPDLSIAEIAHRAGFTNPARMRVQFVRTHGVTPAAYRDSIHAVGRRRPSS